MNNYTTEVIVVDGELVSDKPRGFDGALWLFLLVASPFLIAGAGLILIANVAIARVVIDAVGYLLS